MFLISMLLVFGLKANAINFDSNVPQDVVTKVNSDLQLVTTIQGAGLSPLQKQIYGPVDGPNYMTWFDQRIETFGYDNSGRTGIAVAYNASPSGYPKTMMVTDYFVKSSQPQLARILVLFHEARHSEEENGYWEHINCPTPYNDDKGQPIKSIFTGNELAGQPGCDTTYLGAYGASTVMINNISRFCANCSDKIKSDADIYSQDQVYRLVNESDRAALRSDFRATAP